MDDKFRYVIFPERLVKALRHHFGLEKPDEEKNEIDVIPNSQSIVKISKATRYGGQSDYYMATKKNKIFKKKISILGRKNNS